MTKRIIVAVRGDTQSGHDGGLVNPETEIPEIDFDKTGKRVIAGVRYPELRPVQKHMWKWHEEARTEIEKLAGKDEILFLEMGDMTQGTIFKDNLAEAELNAQLVIARYSMIPWLNMKQVQAAKLVKGTGVHVWGNGATETILSAYLSAMYPKKSIKLTDHWLLNIDGYYIDTAHHGAGPGTRNWTKGNSFSLYMKSILRDALDYGDPVPDMVLRAHYHTFTYGHAYHQVGSTIHKSEGYIIPPMCFIGSHARKVIASPGRMGIGMMALEIVDGKLYDTHYFIHEIDLRTAEVI